MPYAIDFLNPAPDFERERITDFYFRHVVEKMAHLVIDRALNGHPSQSWPRWEEMLGIGPASGFTGAPAAARTLMDAVAAWTALLRPERELTPEFCASLADAMRERKLTFGDRVHCPVLRPFFLTAADETRIRAASETIAAIGERVVGGGDGGRAAARGARRDRGRGAADRHRSRLCARQHRVAARRVPAAGLAALRRVQRRVAGRPRLHAAALRAVRRRSSRWRALRREFARAPITAPIPPLLAALLDSYREWGGTASPPTIAIVDWRDVPTWTEFELLRDAFVEAGVPTVVCDPRDLDVRRRRAARRRAARSISSTGACCINDILARPDECASAGRRLRAARGVRRQHLPLQAAAQEGVLRGADRSAFAPL